MATSICQLPLSLSPAPVYMISCFMYNHHQPSSFFWQVSSCEVEKEQKVEGAAVIFARFPHFITIHLLKHTLSFYKAPGNGKSIILSVVCWLREMRKKPNVMCLYFPCVVLIVINSNWSIGRHKIDIIRRRWGQHIMGLGHNNAVAAVLNHGYYD